MADYNPISFKYISGWGEVNENAALTNSMSAGNIDDLKKLLRKFPKKDREYFNKEWKKLYTFYSGALLDEQAKTTAQKDGYLRNISRDLGLEEEFF